MDSCHNKFKMLTRKKLIISRKHTHTRQHFQKEAPLIYKWLTGGRRGNFFFFCIYSMSFQNVTHYSHQRCQFQCQTAWGKIHAHLLCYNNQASIPKPKVEIVEFASDGLKQMLLGWHRVSISKWKILVSFLSTAYRYSMKWNTNIILDFQGLII